MDDVKDFFRRMRLSYMKQQMRIHIWQSYLGTVAIGGLQLEYKYKVYEKAIGNSSSMVIVRTNVAFPALTIHLFAASASVGGMVSDPSMISHNSWPRNWMMKSDVYIFGLLLMELITKTKLDLSHPFVLNICKPDSFVHKYFKDVDDRTTSDITELTCCCMSLDPGERPTMKMVFVDLEKLRTRVKVVAMQVMEIDDGFVLLNL
ncbi:hypothetical protein H5410_047408 [Solanum commersonii]|uniref:Serine-threonine/tyrosine-protein kinase catalytic domain-containing protein n=1 Tax=Solanum commersonii TaxID=4109 RepID=A0A9J5XIL1_SOLCO|nr:hypothetical protein H5410_047408 [Solanum commersonii]